MSNRIIAVDFDGTLCESAWPEIGQARSSVINYVLDQQAAGAKLILWTNRVGERLEEAVKWCAAHGLTFDAVNENLPEIVEAFGGDTRKVFANVYLDDRAMLPEIAEPRVLSLEEVVGLVALESETPIYMEFGRLATNPGKVIGLIPKYMGFDDEHGLSWDVCEGPDQGKRDGVSLYEYNDIWRCWTLRPTDMQKEAMKWGMTEQENAIPIDWLMRYAQLPTEFAIAEWRKPKKEALIKQAKSGDKSMSFDDALRLVDDQREETPWQ